MGKNSSENKNAAAAQSAMFTEIRNRLRQADEDRAAYRRGSEERMRGIRGIGEGALKRFQAYERGEDVAGLHPMLAGQIGDISKNYQALSRFTGSSGNMALMNKDLKFTQKLTDAGLRDIAKAQGAMIASAGAQARERDLGEYINAQGAQVGEERFGLGLTDVGFNQAGSAFGAAGQWRSAAQSDLARQQAGIGNIVGAGISLASLSDERVKSNKKKSEYGLDEVMKLDPITYDIGGKKEVGYSAQDVKKEVPELSAQIGGGLLGVDYGKMTAVQGKAIQELKAEIDELKKKKGKQDA